MANRVHPPRIFSGGLETAYGLAQDVLLAVSSPGQAGLYLFILAELLFVAVLLIVQVDPFSKFLA